MPSRILAKPVEQIAELEDFSTPLYNIQFHVTAVHGLWPSSSPPSSPTTPQWLPKIPAFQRVVHVTAKGERYIFREHTDGVPESISTWNENMRQMGPLRDSDRITFRVMKRLPWALPGHGTTVATSEEYSLKSLLIMQGKQETKTDIKIPLKSNHGDKIEATLLLQVREPTTTFVSKQWMREATKLKRKSEELREKIEFLEPVKAVRA